MLIIALLLTYKNLISITTSSSDVNGIYLNLPTKLYNNIDNSGTLIDNPLLKKCRQNSYCNLLLRNDNIYTVYARNQFVGFCLPTYFATEVAFNAGLPKSNLCTYGGTPLLKHIAGIPGDKLKVTMDGVLVNGKLISNSKILSSTYSVWSLGTEQIIPNGYYYIAGLNLHSYDSRYYGLVFQGFIISKSYLLWKF